MNSEAVLLDRDQFASAADYAYAALRKEIVEGRFPPGRRMREIELAQLLGISRTPTRQALSRLELEGLLVVYTVRHLSQVQMLYRAKLKSTIAPGVESLEVRLFDWQDIPWGELAFPSVEWMLKHYQSTKHLPALVPAAIAVE